VCAAATIPQRNIRKIPNGTQVEGISPEKQFAVHISSVNVGGADDWPGQWRRVPGWLVQLVQWRRKNSWHR
jgi:hypothetical protein